MTETRHDDLEVLAAAYAIDALDGDERKQFESHLSECAVCREHVAAYRSVTAALALGTEPVDPPASLRQRTIARASGKRASAQVQAPATAARPSFVWLAAAAAILLTVATGLYAYYQRALANTYHAAMEVTAQQERELRKDLAGSRAEARQLSRALEVLSSPDLTRIELAGAGGAAATGRAFWSPSRGVLLNADRLPSLPPGRAYQLWIVLPNAAPKGAGLFTVTAAGSGTLVAQPTANVAVPRNTVMTLAITNEPAGGSHGPTTPILLAGTAKTE